jgi:hypothetical protein
VDTVAVSIVDFCSKEVGRLFAFLHVPIPRKRRFTMKEKGGKDMAECPYYKPTNVPMFGRVTRECQATGQNIDETKAKYTCKSDYAKCNVYKSKK